jgi:signal transduction histidine kinase
MQKKRPSFSISLQLSVLIGFFALSLLGFWFLSTDLTKSFISELTIQSNQDRARKLLDDISRQINISLREMQLLARRPMIISSLERQRDNPPTQSLDPMITGYLIDTYQNRYFIDFGSRLFRDIVLVNTHGDLLAYSEKPTPPFLVQLKRDNQISGDLMLWDVQAYNDDSFPGMGIRVPILNEASEEIGALLALMDLGAILSQMDLSLSLSTRLEILKADGSVVYSNGVFQLLAPSQYTSVLQEKMPLRSYLVDQDTGLLFTLSEIQGHGIFSGFGWKLLLATNLESVFSPVDKLTGLNTSLFLGILLFTLLMAYLIARSFVKPLLDFQSGALELGAGNLNYRFTGSGPSEINDLAQVLNQMSQNLQNSYNQLKTKEAQSKELAANLEESNKDLEEFAYIASHDLQEPLRKVIAYGDLLTEEYKDSLAGEGQHYIGVMQNAAERMSNLISNLLEYSRISSKDLRPNSLQVEEILQEVKSNLSLIMEGKYSAAERTPFLSESDGPTESAGSLIPKPDCQRDQV